MTADATCPYCNARVPASAGPACPRCGELLPGAAGGGGEPAVSDAGPRPGDSRPRLARSAALLLLGGLAAAGVVLWARSRPATETTGPEPAGPPAAQAPAEWPALRWLPGGVDVVAGLHATRAAEVPAAVDLVGRLGLMTATTAGLPLEELDQVVCGVELDAALPPPVVVVVRTRRPYDADSVRSALRAEAVPGKAVERTRPDRAGGREGSLWLADPQTFLLGYSARDLDRVPDRPAADLGRLPPVLADTVRERLPADAVAWAAAHAPAGLPPVLALAMDAAGVPERDREAIVGLRDLAVGLRPGEPPALELAARGADEEATDLVGSALAPRLPGLGFEAARRGRSGDWFAVTARKAAK